MQKIALIFPTLLFSFNVFAQGNIQFLLSKNSTVVFGPNCWNSVLYVKGFAPGIYYSDGELPFWLNSPVCKVIKKQKSGDIIDITNLSDSEKDYNSLHSYIYLDEMNGFTKNGPNLEEPYQISAHSEINHYYKLTDSSCLNITREQGLKRKCELISTAYRCKNITSFIPKLAQSGVYKRLSVITQQITSRVFSTSNLVLIDIDGFKEIRDTAKKEINLPTFDSLPLRLQSVIRNYFGLNSGGRYNTQEFRDYITEIVYLNAYPDQRIQLKGSRQGKLIKEFRLMIDYSRVSSKNFYLRAHLLNTTRNILSQIEKF